MTSLLVLSPHLDDAVYSVGGQLARRVRAGEAPVVLNLFAGRPGAALSPLARAFHERQGVDDLVAHRIELDRAALDRVGARPVYLAFRDCIYRGAAAESADGAVWYYTDPSQVFGPPHPDEGRLAEELAEAIAPHLPGDRRGLVLAPLAVGGHVDHRLARDAARLLAGQGWAVRFYEDVPYILREGAVDAALADAGAEGWRSETVFLDPEDFQAKLEAIALYRSSLALEEFAAMTRQTGAGHPAERTWAP